MHGTHEIAGSPGRTDDYLEDSDDDDDDAAAIEGEARLLRCLNRIR